MSSLKWEGGGWQRHVLLVRHLPTSNSGCSDASIPCFTGLSLTASDCLEHHAKADLDSPSPTDRDEPLVLLERTGKLGKGVLLGCTNGKSVHMPFVGLVTQAEFFLMALCELPSH